MNFTELYNEVQSIVKRPDLVDRINSAILASTLKLHSSDFYYKDQIETGVSFVTPNYIQNFDPRQIFTNYRKLSYIRRWNYDATATDLGCAANFFDPIGLGNTKDAYGYDKTEVFYMAGQLVQLRGASEISHVLAGAIVHPVVASPTNYISWIADEYPYAIIYDSAKAIFGQIGLQEQAAAQTAEAQYWLAILRINSDAMPQP